MKYPHNKLLCICPICKKEFDITEIVQPIRDKAIEEFVEGVKEYGKKTKEI